MMLISFPLVNHQGIDNAPSLTFVLQGFLMNHLLSQVMPFNIESLSSK